MTDILGYSLGLPSADREVQGVMRAALLSHADSALPVPQDYQRKYC